MSQYTYILHSTVLLSIIGDILLTAAAQTTMAPEAETDEDMDWKVIFAYVCFALGGALLLFGFARIVYYVVKKRKRAAGSTESGKDLVREYYSSPWLKGNTYASAHRNSITDDNQEARQRADDDDILHDVDVNAFYSTPADDRGDQGDQYGGRSNRAMLSEVDFVEDPIYSIPHDSRNGIGGAHAQLNSDDITSRGIYSEPVKPRNDIRSTSSSQAGDLQTLHAGSLQRQQKQQQNSSALNRSVGVSITDDSDGQEAVLSALDAATGSEVDALHYETIPGAHYSYADAETQPKQSMHIDRTLAAENEIEYTFSSSVYVHTF